MDRACNTYGRIQKCTVLVGRPERIRPLGRPRHRWEDNIKMDLREVGYDGRDWINLAQDSYFRWPIVPSQLTDQANLKLGSIPNGFCEVCSRYNCFRQVLSVKFYGLPCDFVSTVAIYQSMNCNLPRLFVMNPHKISFEYFGSSAMFNSSLLYYVKCHCAKNVSVVLKFGFHKTDESSNTSWLSIGLPSVFKDNSSHTDSSLLQDLRFSWWLVCGIAMERFNHVVNGKLQPYGEMESFQRLETSIASIYGNNNTIHTVSHIGGTEIKGVENKVLREIFGAKRDEITGEWRKLNNAELHALYSSPDIIRNIKSRRLRWAGHVARMSESRPRRRREDNIKTDLRGMGYDDRDWIDLAQDRDRWAYVRATMNLQVP
ncbi:hypothetical protein ANN_06358 [Periplaneta americana]|uniref:Uncharacterized protein n=1 Tax=Periplaneta americana TaxID=6978 RepID=A0ABQ8TE73_PERAM|nr:hypothetical protein ANN_06358 [Periplaneta americana]